MILNDSGRAETVKGICSFEQNFTMREFKEYGKSMDEVLICHIVISACPTSAALSLTHHTVSFFLSPFLGSMPDFMGKGGMEDSVEEGDAIDVSTVSLSTITFPSGLGFAGNGEYPEVEGN